MQEEKVSDQIVKNIFSFKATYAANLAKTGGIESFYLASFEVNLEKHPDANPPSRKLGLVRFPENPAPFWGPKARAKSAKAE